MIHNNFGGWCDTCFCFRDVRRAIVAIGMLSLLCSLAGIAVQVAVFTGAKGEDSDFSVQGSEKEKLTYQLYIAVAVMDALLAIFSILLLYGNERSDEIRARKFLLPWVIILPVYIIYESAINIYYFNNQFNQRYEDPLADGHFKGYAVVPLVYWVVKDVLMFISFIFVVMRIQSLTPIIEYVREEEGCGCHAPAPAISLPTPVTFNTGGCSSGACGRANPQPAYGYYGGAITGAKTHGWTSNVYSR